MVGGGVWRSASASRGRLSVLKAREIHHQPPFSQYMLKTTIQFELWWIASETSSEKHCSFFLLLVVFIQHT